MHWYINNYSCIYLYILKKNTLKQKMPHRVPWHFYERCSKLILNWSELIHGTLILVSHKARRDCETSLNILRILSGINVIENKSSHWGEKAVLLKTFFNAKQLLYLALPFNDWGALLKTNAIWSWRHCVLSVA